MPTSSHRFFPRSSLVLEKDSSGARFWGIALDKAMLRYFEAPAGTRFETHQHDSEQITLVLDGELAFELEGHTVIVGPGEVIAIPSNVPHAVFNREQPVRAVDAWSPVMEKYKS